MPLRSANVVGSGPNGLAAAISLVRAGVQVTVFERNPVPGGACRTEELTLPGFHHDVGASVFPLAAASPFFRSLPLENLGLEWIEPHAPLAHPLDDRPAVLLEHSLAATAAQFGPQDRRNWQSLLAPGIRDWHALTDDFLRGLMRLPRHPFAMACFGAVAGLPARALARTVFSDEPARALFAGCAAHAVVPLTNLASSATGLVLATAGHTSGWPVARGGAGEIAQALVTCLAASGVPIHTSMPVRSLGDLPPADVTLFDTSPETLLQITGERLCRPFRTRLAHVQHGPGIFKIDYALGQPIPWRDPACLRAATVHVGGTLDEIAASEADAYNGRLSPKPFVLVVQPSLADPSRAPRGQHTAWAYCHVPNGCPLDQTAAIEAQLERFAPGFRDVVLARRTWSPLQLEQWNPNLRGGDLSGGAMTFGGMIARPTLRGPRTSDPRLYIASSSTWPGGGVHGMCGVLAAEAALRDHRSG